MKTNQISNAHSSYGKTTSGRPSPSLPSWILRSLIYGNSNNDNEYDDDGGDDDDDDDDDDDGDNNT